MAYASTTSVPVEKTRAEIEKLLMKAGATDFTSGSSTRDGLQVARIGVTLKDRMLLFSISMPLPKERRFTHLKPADRWSRERSKTQAEKLWEQACRSRWRALLLCIRAKLESVEQGIETFEQAFLAQVLLPGGQTMGDWAGPVIAQVYGGAPMPQMKQLGPGVPDIIDAGGDRG